MAVLTGGVLVVKRSVVVVVVALLLAGPSCSGGDDTAGSSTTAKAATTTTTEEAGPGKVTVLVTNDDGVKAPGIDAIVSALSIRDDLRVVVVAPAENQSGQGGKTSPGPLTVTDTTTASGFPAKAVVGYPADAVLWALGDGGIKPDLVVSGINAGQNVGPLVPLSGTVGAARQAAQKGVPAVAASQGLADPPDYPTGVKAVLDWVDQHLATLQQGKLPATEVTSINVPSCPGGKVQGTVVVPVATSSTADLNAVDCAGTAEPVDDVSAFTNGWIAVSELVPTGSKTQ